MNTPKEVIDIVSNLAINKSKYPKRKTLILAFLAGAYVAFGGLLAIIVGGGSPGIAAENPGMAKFLFGATFPLGLILVVIAGAELFTGNNAYFFPNILAKKQPVSDMLKNWGLVYVGNFVGSIFVAYAITHLTHIVSEAPFINTVHNVALGKTSHTFLTTFLKGIGANWLVCLAVWQGMAAKSTTGKVLGVWFPVMAFVTMGFEHSIANMYFIPLAIFEGADITWATFIINNLIPATLGNIVGGGIFVGILYGYVFPLKSGKDKKEDQLRYYNGNNRNSFSKKHKVEVESEPTNL
ncbi:formate/nitrite transporter family protein [Maribacter polysaccharolyticus]|uniref:formate/nitrite transporter family protein n=1 Tax=Maribacter polysaccharolyticus TaxID=3020831 RepID=UPI00237FA39A|nr:formate/nitrite transporter family protein [Maribacter polysaccharolyticus]MDE3743849.1 formate/nitrite transporter family protein [Maribacter polysaccharolyticus]